MHPQKFSNGKKCYETGKYTGNRNLAIFLSILINKPVSVELYETKVFSGKFFKVIKQNWSWDSKSDLFGDFKAII